MLPAQCSFLSTILEARPPVQFGKRGIGADW